MAPREMHYIITLGDDLIAITQTVQRPWLLNYRSWESHAPLDSCRTSVPPSSFSYEAFGIQHDPWIQQQNQSLWYLPVFTAKEFDFWWAQTVVQTALSLPVIRNSLICRVNTLLFLKHFCFFWALLSFSFDNSWKAEAPSRKLRRQQCMTPSSEKLHILCVPHWVPGPQKNTLK